MSQQDDHVNYTRHEWTSVPCFVEMINFLKNKNIKSFADIGANVGEVSKIMLESLPTLNEVLAYEPESLNFLYLKNRFLNDSRIKPVKKAIFYGCDKKNLWSNGSCGSNTLAEQTNYVTETVDTVQFENENLNHIDLIKMDVEGAEYNIIENSTFLKTVKYIIIEFHPWGLVSQEFYKNLPPSGKDTRDERARYIKTFTDNFIKKYLPNHQIVIECEEQYLLELYNF